MRKMTYGNVKQFVETKLGTIGCSITDIELEHAMSSCLIDAWAQVSDWKNYRKVWQLPVESDVYAYSLPDDLGSIDRIDDHNGRCLSGGNEWDVCEDKTTIVRRVITTDGCTGEVSYPTLTLPKTWLLNEEDGEVILAPTPFFPPGTLDKVFKVYGYRKPECIFFDIKTINNQTVKVWREIDLPLELHPAFCNCVTGLVLNDFDSSQAANYLALGNDLMATQLSNKRSSLKTTSDNHAMFSKGKRCGCSSGCSSCVPIGVPLTIEEVCF